jgi:nuclear protein localization family protein 4
MSSPSFEPMQISSKVHIEFGLDAQAMELTAQADEIAAAAGLKRVGFMFTDLEPDASKPRRYLEKRHAGTYFLKSNEVVLAAHLQSMFPNRCDFSESGYAGSKFSTVVLSGNSFEQDNIEPQAYQVRLINSLLFASSQLSNAFVLFSL